MSQRRSALGRGLGALISNPPGQNSAPERSTRERVDTEVSRIEEAPAGSASQEIDVDLIDPNPDQPRREFDAAALEGLSRSIGQHGVLQPVVVRRAGARFELVMGERRFRASQLAGRRSVPAVVLDVDPADRLELAIVENVQRQDLNPIELAHAYQALADAGHTQEQIGEKVAMDRSSIANHIRLLDLSRAIQTDVEASRLSMGHAKALLQVHDLEARERLRDQIAREGLSVRATERIARGGGPSASTPRPAGADKSVPSLDADTRAFVERIERRLQTKVSLHPAKGGAGRIEIRYFDLDDLERVGGLLLGESAGERA
jgi:ParB family chromosome partitioning protein